MGRLDMPDKCIRCKKYKWEPSEHEYCDITDYPTYYKRKGIKELRALPLEIKQATKQKLIREVVHLFEKEDVIPFGGEHPHYSRPEPIPEQKPITHHMMPKNARPGVTEFDKLIDNHKKWRIG